MSFRRQSIASAIAVVALCLYTAKPALSQQPGGPTGAQIIKLDIFETNIGDVNNNPSFASVSIGQGPAFNLDCTPVAGIPTCVFPMAGANALDAVISGWVQVKGCGAQSCENFSDVVHFIDLGGAHAGQATSLQFFSDRDTDMFARDVGVPAIPAGANTVIATESTTGARYSPTNGGGPANTIVIHSECSDDCSVVPEPGTFGPIAGLLAMSLSGFAYRVWRR